jgi:hypothetical protein
MPAMVAREITEISLNKNGMISFRDTKKLNPRTGKPIIETGQRVTALVREIYDYAEVTGKAHIILLLICISILKNTKAMDEACK